MKKLKIRHVWVASIYKWLQFVADLVYLRIFTQIRLDWIKGDCWDLAEVYALLSAILVIHVYSQFFVPNLQTVV